MDEGSRNRRFDALVWPHAGAAYNLARWICRDESDAKDIVQESFVRALQYFGGFRGGDARAWLLSIVRNTAFTWLRINRRGGETAAGPGTVADATLVMAGTAAGVFDVAEIADDAPDPAANAEDRQEALRLRRLISKLPLEQREVLVLREFEEFGYREIAAIIGSPIGTVMSRLARARDGLSALLLDETNP